MKDLTKLINDLISFGCGIERQDTDIQTTMSCLAGIMLNQDVAHLGFINYNAIQEHIEAIRRAHRGADFDIDKVRPQAPQLPTLGIKDIIEFHGKYTIKLNDGRELSFDSFDITHY